MSKIVICRHPRIFFGYVAEVLSNGLVADSLSFAKKDKAISNFMDLNSWLHEINQKGEYRVFVSDGANLFRAGISES